MKVRKGGSEEIPLIQGEELPLIQDKEQQLHFAGTGMKRYSRPKARETQVRC